MSMDPTHTQPSPEPMRLPDGNQGLRTARRGGKQVEVQKQTKVTEASITPLKGNQSDAEAVTKGIKGGKVQEPSLVKIESGSIVKSMPPTDAEIDKTFLHRMSREEARHFLQERPNGDYMILKESDNKCYLVCKDNRGQIQEEELPSGFPRGMLPRYSEDRYGAKNLIDRDTFNTHMPFKDSKGAQEFLANQPANSFVIRPSLSSSGSFVIDIKGEKGAWKFDKISKDPDAPKYQFSGKEWTLPEAIEFIKNTREGTLVSPEVIQDYEEKEVSHSSAYEKFSESIIFRNRSYDEENKVISNVSRGQAETILREKGDFLFRPSSQAGYIAVSINVGDKVLHSQIIQDGSLYKILPQDTALLSAEEAKVLLSPQPLSTFVEYYTRGAAHLDSGTFIKYEPGMR